MALLWLPWSTLRASDAEREAAMGTPPLERLGEPKDVRTVLSGGDQSKRGALPVRSDLFEGAVYSSRGRGYAPYNEDAAALVRDEKGRFYIAVLDQAGGLGGSVRGAASELAAHRLFDTFREVISRADHETLQELEKTMTEAHEELIARREGEVTTAVAGVFRKGRALLVSSGDSAALHFSAQGEFRARTNLHEYKSPLQMGCLTHAIGLVPEGAAPEPYTWRLETGDWVLTCSDGLLDSPLTHEDLGEFLKTSSSAEEAVNRICTKILRLMGSLRGKPDNLTLVAIRAL